jgi:hypothetical protein
VKAFVARCCRGGSLLSKAAAARELLSCFLSNRQVAMKYIKVYNIVSLSGPCSHPTTCSTQQRAYDPTCASLVHPALRQAPSLSDNTSGQGALGIVAATARPVITSCALFLNHLSNGATIPCDTASSQNTYFTRAGHSQGDTALPPPHKSSQYG